VNRLPARDALNDSLRTNVTGPVSLTEALLPALRKSTSPRIVFVSSSMGSLTLNSDRNARQSSTALSEYRVTKAALNMVLVQYHLKLPGCIVIGADPGQCATNIIGDPDAIRRMGSTEPDFGGAIVASVVKGDHDEHAGKVYGPSGVNPW
jgi:NAD(P)-dependent dehydrogenase (short-subunit alcohol dehydrogenase family)